MEYYVENKQLIIKINSLVQKTIQDFLNDYIPSKKMQHLLIQNKWIMIDDKPSQRNHELLGKYLKINLYPEDYHYYHSSHKKLDVVYEDELCLIVNKPSGMIVHSDGNGGETLCDLVMTYFHDTGHFEYNVHPIHRLDEDTCGLVFFSKSIIFDALFDQMLEKKLIRRNYLAFIKGKVNKNTSFEIDKPIGKDRHNAKKMVIYKNGQKALTKVRSLGTNDKGYSVFLCRLQTGRTHQIRLHLSSEGYPILNDPLYGVSSHLMSHMGLVGYELAFYHPLKDENMQVQVDLKDEFKYLYEAIE